MISHILLEGDLDPTISVGGILKAIGGNIRVGNSGTFITEACEYTNSFLEFYPLYSIILNVEEDHMDFFKDIEDIKNSFHKFASQTADDGLIIINGDMEHTDFICRAYSPSHQRMFAGSVEGLYEPLSTYASIFVARSSAAVMTKPPPVMLNT